LQDTFNLPQKLYVQDILALFLKKENAEKIIDYVNQLYGEKNYEKINQEPEH